VVCFVDNLNEQLQNHNGMNGYNYDCWLNSNNPYNNELDDELIDHLTEMRDLETEEDQEEYCEKHDLKFNDIKHYL